MTPDCWMLLGALVCLVAFLGVVIAIQARRIEDLEEEVDHQVNRLRRARMGRPQWDEVKPGD